LINDEGSKLIAAPAPQVPRSEVIDELYAVARGNAHALHDGRWSRATVEACLALLESDRSGRDVMLSHQVPPPDLVSAQTP